MASSQAGHDLVEDGATALGIPVWAPADARDELGEHDGVHAAVAGASFVVGTLPVQVAGGRHAEGHPEHPGPENR